MKRFGTWLSLVVVASIVAGCDGGGIQEGSATDAAGGPPANFQAEMEKNAKSMQLKGGRPKAATKKAG